MSDEKQQRHIMVTPEQIKATVLCRKYMKDDYSLVDQVVPSPIPILHLTDMRRLRGVEPHERLWVLTMLARVCNQHSMYVSARTDRFDVPDPQDRAILANIRGVIKAREEQAWLKTLVLQARADGSLPQQLDLADLPWRLSNDQQTHDLPTTTGVTQ